MLGMGGFGIPAGLLWSAGNVNVTSSTIPTNGLYLPAANTLGWATNSALRGQVSTTAFSFGLNTIVGSTSVTPDGTLHVHTATAGTVTPNANADDFIIENSDAGGMTILGPDASDLNIFYGSPTNNAYVNISGNYTAGTLTAGTRKVGGSFILRGGDGIPNLTLSGAAGSELATFVRHVTMTNGDLTISAGDLIITTATTPASAAAAGAAGTVAWDADYIYIATATNTWKRVAIATWP